MSDAHYPQRGRRAPATRVGVLAALAFLVLSACSSAPSHIRLPAPGHQFDDSRTQSNLPNEVLIRAIGLVGTPYRYGGNTPAGGFDCSGLVDYVFLDVAGLRLPRSTRELIDLRAQAVGKTRLRAGDLLFFNPGGGAASHIGIYVGQARFVHAPRAGGTVRLDTLDSQYWSRYYLGAKRVLR